MEKIVFRQDDFDNIEMVRQIVLARLKYQPNWSQFDYSWNAQEYVEFENDNLRSRFLILATEVMWQFISQGLITPGSDAANPALPWFRITDYGKKILEEERFIAHDPTGYIKNIKSNMGQVMNDYGVEVTKEA